MFYMIGLTVGLLEGFMIVVFVLLVKTNVAEWLARLT